MHAISLRLTIVPLLVLAILATSIAMPSAASEDAPYLYYYSDLLNAFVIERADGTDSRTLAAGVMPEDYNAIGRPGWSPSGRWFAWTGARVEGGGTTASSVWLISADGTRHFDGLEQVRLGEYGGVSWSPFEDKLLIVDDMQLWDQGGGHVYYFVDADTEQIITLFETERNWRVCGSTWSPDGRYMMFYNVPPSTGDEPQTFLRAVSRAGDIQDRKVDGVAMMLSYACPAISETGWFLYHTPDKRKLIGENLFSGEYIELDPLPDVIMLAWSPGGSYGLLWRENTETLWLLSVIENKMFPIADHIPYDLYHPIIRWSPIQDSAVFWAAEGQLQLLDAATHQVTTVIEDAENIRFYWQDDGKTLVVENDQKVFLYDLTSRTTRAVADLHIRDGVNTSLSPDLRYIGLTGFVTSPTILDTTTGQFILSMPYSGGPSWRVEAYRWQDASEWVFAAENTSFAGGGGGPEGVSILKTDGTLRRELTLIEFSTTSVNWLPDRVIPYLTPGNPTSVLQQPLMTLEHAGSVNGVAWNVDGNRLASNASNAQQEPFLYLWSINQTTTTQISAFPVEPCGGLPIPCLLRWSPDGSLIGAVTLDTVSIWDATTGKQVETEDRTWLPSASNPLWHNLTVYSLDGSLVAQFSQEKGVQIRDTRSNHLILDLPHIRAERILWAANSQYLALIDSDVRLRLWQIPSGQEVSLDPISSAYPWDIAFSPDGKLLAQASWWGKIAIWDTASGALLTRLNWYAKAIDFSPDSTRLAAAGSWAVTIWDVSRLDSE